MPRLNSKYHVGVAVSFGADVMIILESRGGRKTGPSARNPDYSKQLSRILRKLKKHECRIVRIEVLSKVAYQRGDKRKLALNYPIQMSQVSSIEDLRKDIQAAQRNLVQKPGASGGNTTKRIGIWIKVGSNIPAIGLKYLLSI